MMTPPEQVVRLRLVMMVLQELTDENALAGVVLTDAAFDKIKELFGPSARAYNPGGFVADPMLNDVFVVDGLLFMRGTQLQ
jgi:hypothetical protein